MRTLKRVVQRAEEIGLRTCDAGRPDRDQAAGPQTGDHVVEEPTRIRHVLDHVPESHEVESTGELGEVLRKRALERLEAVLALRRSDRMPRDVDPGMLYAALSEGDPEIAVAGSDVERAAPAQVGQPLDVG